MKKISFIISCFLLFCSVSYGVTDDAVLSQFATQRIYDFFELRALLKSSPSDEEAVASLSQERDKTLEGLKIYAVDYEQEKCILETFYLLETYEHTVTLDNRDELRKVIKKRMQDDVRCLNERSSDKTSKWLYYACGDVTSYYMTRSVGATLRYGLKVKKWYEKALDTQDGSSGAGVSLGNWMYYAPAPFGSKKKSESSYLKAIDLAKVDGERYLAYEYLSQFYFEDKKYDLCEKYLDLALGLDYGSAEIRKIKKLNAEGISLYQYNRTRCGIDEEIPDENKQEDD